MKKLLIFPTWVLVKILIHILPNTHRFYGQKITLDSWAKHATQLNYLIAVVFWVQTIPLYIFINFLIKH